MKMNEGKMPMSKTGYEFLSRQAIQAKQDFSLNLMCHTFLIFCWNLMARSVTVASIMYDRMDLWGK